MVFRIKYQSQYRRFSVVKILNEEGLYNKLHTYLTPNEGTTAAVMEMESGSSSLNPYQLTPTCEQSSVAQPDSAANLTGSPSASCSSTPAKRVAMSTSINDLIQAEELTPKQSTTKAKNGKKTKQIKKD
ncbi:uncharacterized protein LOC131624980 [Vicia villosa]|uniref:uncharacterized protein LOC131624980 n=1 Tax=Vicia villosa TaxID=3911 RepID=UPI00273C3CF1|nr:uncharacterized protein LOC131624980 [Vicia villosa]